MPRQSAAWPAQRFRGEPSIPRRKCEQQEPPTTGRCLWRRLKLLLEHYLKTLRLLKILREHDKVARRAPPTSRTTPVAPHGTRITRPSVIYSRLSTPWCPPRQLRFPGCPGAEQGLRSRTGAMRKLLARKENVLLLGNSGTEKRTSP